MLLKKVVVVYPTINTEKGTEYKTVYTAKPEHVLYADNTDAGVLVITESKKDLSARFGKTVAVYKEWLYWEKVE